MKITVCDICETKENIRSLYLITDRRMDAAGSVEGVGKLFDLCDACYLNSILQNLKENYKNKIGNWEYEYNSFLIKEIERRIDKR